jgi:hypothetical protein
MPGGATCSAHSGRSDAKQHATAPAHFHRSNGLNFMKLSRRGG